MINIQEKNILSVSQLNRRAKQLLETHIPLIWVSGELSNFAKPGSGHWYFSLKDERAQIRCAMFKQANSRLRWQPTAGMHVLVRARVSLYEGRGDYQLIVEHMEEAGAGALMQAFEDLKAKLQQEGLFDESQKQVLPRFPQHIGIITSPTGAAVRDILAVIQRRYPIVKTTIIPVAVQGAGAASDIVGGIKKAIKFAKFDVLILSRGGGSIEDLWAFNDETLARTINACPIPIISAVGHEVDFTIADFVADVRAPTPSVSAEIITPDINEWLQTLDDVQQQLIRHQLRLIQQKQQRLSFLKRRLRHPKEQIQYQQQRLSQIERALLRNITNIIAGQKQNLQATTKQLRRQHPTAKIQLLADKVNQLKLRSQRAITQTLNARRQQLSSSAQLLNAVNPLTVLARGYSITSLGDGTVITNKEQVSVGEELSIKLGRGKIISQVTKITD
jgi:exodeoxyribonuclease VII large subunit